MILGAGASLEWVPWVPLTPGYEILCSGAHGFSKISVDNKDLEPIEIKSTQRWNSIISISNEASAYQGPP